MPRRRALCVALVLLTLPSLAAARDRSVTVDLEVAPASAPISIEISPRGNAQRRWIETVAAGATASIALPGSTTYVVRIQTASGRSSEFELPVGASERITLHVRASGTGAPEVDVRRRRSLAVGTEFGPAELAALPGGGNLVGLLDAAAPFVIVDRFDGGGLATASWGRIGGRGSSWTASRIYLGDAELEGPLSSGAFPFYADMNAFERVSLLGGVAPVEVTTPGTAVSLVPRRPGSQRAGAVGIAFTGGGLVASNERLGIPAIGRVGDWQQADLQWGGPLSTRVGLFIAGAASRVDAQDRDFTLRRTAGTGSLLAHLVASASERDEFRAVVAAQALGRPFDGAQQFQDRDVRERDAFVQASFSWDRRERDGASQAVTLAFSRGAFSPRIGSVDGATIDRTIDGPVPGLASRDVSSAIDAQWRITPRARGRHHPRLSLFLRRAASSSEFLAAPPLAELVHGLPARVRIRTAGDARAGRHVTSGAVALADEIAVSPRFVLDLGLRAEVSGGSADGAAEGTTWRALSPLVAFQWTPRRFIFHGAFRQYKPRLSPDLLAFGDPAESVTEVHRWTDPNGDRRFSADELGTLIALEGRHPSIAAIDAALDPPRTNEYTLGGGVSIGESNFVRGAAVIRKERGTLRVHNVGVPLSGYQQLFVPNEIDNPLTVRDGLVEVFDRLPSSFGADRFLLTNAVGEEPQSYEAIEIAWELRARRWYSMAGLAAYRAEGLGGNRGFRSDEADPGVLGEQGANPNAATWGYGRTFFDRAYVFKWSTVLTAPGGWRIGTTARYQDGQPFSRLVIAPDLSQGPELVSVDWPGSTRFTFTATIDTRIEKSFSFNGRPITAAVDIFNLTNHGNEVEEQAVSGPGFRRSTALQPPLTIRLGVRAGF